MDGHRAAYQPPAGKIEPAGPVGRLWQKEGEHFEIDEGKPGAEVLANRHPYAAFLLRDSAGPDNEDDHRKERDRQLERRQGAQDSLEPRVDGARLGPRDLLGRTIWAVGPDSSRHRRLHSAAT